MDPMAELSDRIAALPGADTVAEGLEDLRRGVATVPALAVSMAASRLRAVGIAVPTTDVQRPSHELYELLAAGRSDAHAGYNALVRRIVSFSRAAEHARSR